MILNCVNCGAPIESDKKACPYCKTPYGLRTKIELEPYIDSNGRICRHEPEMIEVTNLEECEHRFIRKSLKCVIFAMGKNHIKLHMENLKSKNWAI